jgi:hypothetical protein
VPAPIRTPTSASAQSLAAFAKAHGYAIVDEFYAAAVSGADPIAESVKAMLDRVAGNGVADRFARDLTAQLLRLQEPHCLSAVAPSRPAWLTVCAAG